MRVFEIGSDSNLFTVTQSGTESFFVPVIPSADAQALTDAGAVNVTSFYTSLTTTGAAAVTLADGTLKGQLKRIQMIVDVGDATLTPSNLADGTTITFADVGDTVDLLFDGTNWQVLAAYNIVDGATAPAVA